MPIKEHSKPTATEPPVDPHAPFVTVSHGMRGYYAVLMWWNPDLGGFWEPYQTASSSFTTLADAMRDGEGWAEAEDVAFL